MPKNKNKKDKEQDQDKFNTTRIKKISTKLTSKEALKFEQLCNKHAGGKGSTVPIKKENKIIEYLKTMGASIDNNSINFDNGEIICTREKGVNHVIRLNNHTVFVCNPKVSKTSGIKAEVNIYSVPNTVLDQMKFHKIKGSSCKITQSVACKMARVFAAIEKFVRENSQDAIKQLNDRLKEEGVKQKASQEIINSLQADKKAMQTDLNKAKIKNAALKKENKQNSEQIAKLQQSILELSKQQKETKKLLQKQVQAVTKNSNRLDEHDKRLTNIDVTLKDIDNKVVVIEKQKSQILNQQDSLEKLKVQLDKEKDAMQQKINNLKVELGNSVAKEVRDGLQNKLTSLEAKIKNNSNQYDILNNKIQENSNKQDSLRQDLLNTFHEEIKNKYVTQEEFKASLQETEKKIEDTYNKLEKAQNMLTADAMQKNALSDEQKNNLNNQIEKLKEQLTDLTSKHDNLEQNTNKQFKEIKQLQNGYQEKLSNMQEDLLKQNEQLKKDYTKSIQQNTESIKKLSLKYDDFNQKQEKKHRNHAATAREPACIKE